MDDSKRKEGIINNIVNTKDLLEFRKMIRNQIKNIRNTKNAFNLFEKFLSINDSKHFKGEIVDNLIKADVSKNKMQVIRELIELNHVNEVEDKSLFFKKKKLERLDYIKEILKRYSDRSYIDALDRIHSLYDKKETQDAINEIKSLICNIERNFAEETLENVRENPEIINKSIKKYEDYCKKKIIIYLDLSDIFESVLEKLYHIKNPKLAANIKMLEIRKEIDHNWYINYEEFLRQYKEIKPRENMYLQSELSTIRQILHKLLEEAREFLNSGFWKGTFKRCNQALEIIRDYSNTYNLEATREIINRLKNRALLDINQLKSKSFKSRGNYSKLKFC